MKVVGERKTLGGGSEDVGLGTTPAFFWSAAPSPSVFGLFEALNLSHLQTHCAVTKQCPLAARLLA